MRVDGAGQNMTGQDWARSGVRHYLPAFLVYCGKNVALSFLATSSWVAASTTYCPSAVKVSRDFILFALRVLMSFSFQVTMPYS